MPGSPISRYLKFYDHAQRFDGLRFYRSDTDDDAKGGSGINAQDFGGIEPGSVAWSNGRFACPCRRYAAVIIKLIMAKLLLEYDIAFAPGYTKQPVNSTHDTDVHPDWEQKIVTTTRSDF